MYNYAYLKVFETVSLFSYNTCLQFLWKIWWGGARVVVVIWWWWWRRRRKIILFCTQYSFDPNNSSLVQQGRWKRKKKSF